MCKHGVRQRLGGYCFSSESLMNEETRLKLIIDKESTYGPLRRQRRASEDRSKSSLRKQALDSCVDSRRIASKHPHKGTRIDGRVNQSEPGHSLELFQ